MYKVQSVKCLHTCFDWRRFTCDSFTRLITLKLNFSGHWTPAKISYYVFRSNMSSVFHRARDTAMCWSKMKNYLHSVYLFVHVEKEYVRIRRIWHRKKNQNYDATHRHCWRVLRYVKPFSHSVTDKRTHRQKQTISVMTVSKFLELCSSISRKNKHESLWVWLTMQPTLKYRAWCSLTCARCLFAVVVLTTTTTTHTSAPTTGILCHLTAFNNKHTNVKVLARTLTERAA